MGTKITGLCPACGQQELRPADVLLRMSSRDAAANHYRFTCPGCATLVEHPADVQAVRMLRSTGEVPLEHFEPAHLLENRPSACAQPYTEDELLDDLIALAAMPSTEIIVRLWEARR